MGFGMKIMGITATEATFYLCKKAKTKQNGASYLCKIEHVKNKSIKKIHHLSLNEHMQKAN